MRKSLEGIKVLDLSRVFAGPNGSMILGDLGADVIRVESPKGTDNIREWPPFLEGESTYYFSANRNKRSITINLKNDRGKQLFSRMVKKADIVIENFKTGTLDRLGLNYTELKKINPAIIMCSVTGYGQTGPFSKEPGFDTVIQAVSGIMDVTGQPDGEPTKVGTPITDILSSLYVVISILSALRTRDQTDEGQHIDISLLDVGISSLANVASSFLNKEYVTKRVGNQHNNVVPYQVFQCRDKPLMIAAGNDSQFVKLCEVVNHPEWAKEEQFITNALRVENREEITEKLQNVLQNDDADKWFERLSEKGVPSGPVNDIEGVLKHPQVQAREMVNNVEHPSLGNIKVVRNPIQFSSTQIDIEKHPPLLGEHTQTILQEELELTDEEVKQLIDDGAI